MTSNVFTEAAAREALVAAARRLAEAGMLFRGAHANLSARIDGNRVVMTRGGSIARITAEDFAILTLDGTVLSGEMQPAMQEIVQMHTGIYQARQQVGAVIHSHAPHLTAFAVAHRDLPLTYEPMLRFGVTEPIPVVAWAPRGSERSVSAILDVARNQPGLPAVMMANHGVLVFHDSPDSTADLLTTLDEAAELTLAAAWLGGAQALPDEAAQAVRARMAVFGSQR